MVWIKELGKMVVVSILFVLFGKLNGKVIYVEVDNFKDILRYKWIKVLVR